jgi:hypothetical protein
MSCTVLAAHKPQSPEFPNDLSLRVNPRWSSGDTDGSCPFECQTLVWLRGRHRRDGGESRHIARGVLTSNRGFDVGLFIF